MNTTLYQNRPEDTQNWTNLYLKPYDCRIYYVNINLRHQYGISVAESQTFLRAKRPQRRRARRRMFSQATRKVYSHLNNLCSENADLLHIFKKLFSLSYLGIYIFLQNKMTLQIFY